jgi:hypothetical protein
MNNVSYLNQQKKPAKKKSSGPSLKWNLLTGVVVLLTLGLCYVFASLFTNPYSGLNPFPPPTFTSTSSPTALPPNTLQPTWTPTPTIQPTETNTPRPTWTLEPTFTPFSLATRTPLVSPTKTPLSTKTPKPAGPQYASTITPRASTDYLSNSGCDSMYVAGNALDNSGTSVTALQVRLGGSVPGKSFNLTTLTGIATAYGPSGFEFNLGLKPTASKDLLWVQLLDQSGAPLTEQVFLTTYTECSKNLLFVRFQKK